MQIIINKDEVEKVDLSHLAHFLQWNPSYQNYFVQEAGKEPYKLIAYLSKKIGGFAVDIGTLFGSSALALSYNDNTQVLTLDTKRHIPDSKDIVTPLHRQNVKMIVASCQAVLSHVATADIVLLDIDVNLTTEIKKIINELVYYNFKGILVLDNINLTEAMKQLWANVAKHLKKIDVTSLGHHSGTGIIVFDTTHIDIDLL